MYYEKVRATQKETKLRDGKGEELQAQVGEKERNERQRLDPTV